MTTNEKAPTAGKLGDLSNTTFRAYGDSVDFSTKVTPPTGSNNALNSLNGASTIPTQSKPQSQSSTYDFLTWWYGDAAATRYALSYQYPKGNFSNSAHDTIAEMSTAADQHERKNAAGVWFRVTTLNHAVAGRGTVADTQSLVGLWADLDFQGDGHKTKNLPTTEEEARACVARAGLPEPSAWVHTGGGLAAYWKLSDPLNTTTDEGMARAHALSSGWVGQLQAGNPGIKIDSVQDLARVMRLPGTTNRKEERVKAGTVAPCRVLSIDGDIFTVEELEKALEAARVTNVPAPPAPMAQPIIGQTRATEPLVTAARGNTKRPAQARKQWNEGITQFEAMTSPGSGRGGALFNLANQLSHGIRADPSQWSETELCSALYSAATRNGMVASRPDGKNYVELQITNGIKRGISEPWEMLPDFPEQRTSDQEETLNRSAADDTSLDLVEDDEFEDADNEGTFTGEINAVTPTRTELPDPEKVRKELDDIGDTDKRKARAREIAHIVTLARLEEYELQEWRELLNSAAKLAKRDFDEMVKEVEKKRKLTKKALRRNIATSTTPTIEQLDGRPLWEVSNDALAAEQLRMGIGKGELSGLFLRDGLIVRTAAIGEEGYIPPANEEDENGPAQVRPIDKSALSSLIDRTFTCYRIRETNEGEKIPGYTLFPKEAARVAIDIPDMLPNLRRLRGIVHVPTIRKNGSLLDKAGYDKVARLLYLPEPGLVVPSVPERPTADQLRKAVKALDYMVADFKFLTEHDRANYYGILLTPLLRDLIPPPYKLGAIGAPMQGSGKTLLAVVARIIHGGVFRSEMPEDDAELRKAITTILDVSTGPIAHFDNVSGVLRSSVLAGLLTSATWSDRRLGGNEMVTVSNDRLWLITGNNLRLGGDLVRRTLWVTIDPGVPDPHLRTEFAIPDLEGWVRENRGRLIHALLTIIRAWIAAGKPTEARGSDSFGKWVEAVGGILGHAGVPGRFDSKEAARQTVGEDDEEWREFLEAVERVFGTRTWTIRELLGRVEIESSSPYDFTPPFTGQGVPVEALPMKLAEKIQMSGKPLSVNQSLGQWLKNHDGRWAGRLVVRSAGKDRTNKSLWRIERPQGEQAPTE